MKPAQVAKWEKTRARGRTRFIVVYGVLLWGLSTAALMTLVFAVQGQDDWLLRGLFIFVLFPLIGGPMFGLFLWWWTERRYSRAVDR